MLKTHRYFLLVMLIAKVVMAQVPRSVTVPANRPAASSQSPAQASESVAARIAREQLPTVVTIVAVDEHDQPLALGSGFFISSDGIVATNAHVVEGASKLVLRWRDQTGTADRILKFDSKYDLVTLKTTLSGPPVKLGDSETVIIGQDLVVLGNPYGLEGTVSTGILSGIREMDGIKYLQITAPISPGSSGGPVFDSQGRVIGVATATFERGQNLNFALPISLLERLPNANVRLGGVKYVPPDTKRMEDIKELVYASDPIEQLTDYYLHSRLDHLTVSLQNKTNDAIGAFRILLIVKGPSGNILNFTLTKRNFTIPPGLAKQVTLETGDTDGFINNGKKGSYEIRILDFQIISRGGSNLDKLFDRR